MHFVYGMTCQVSGTNLQTRDIRAAATRHTALSSSSHQVRSSWRPPPTLSPGSNADRHHGAGALWLCAVRDASPED